MRLDMVCTCSADGFKEAEERRLRIFHQMGLDEPRDLTEAIILSLAFDFQADAVVEADQWFGVSVVTPLIPDGIYIECDWPSDGLASVWEHLADKFPERVSVKQNTSAYRVRVAERVSSVMLERYETAEAMYRSHRTGAHKDDNDCPRCEDCDVLKLLSILAEHSLQRYWGSEVMTKAVEEAFER